MKDRNYIFLFIFTILIGCVNKPFQPVPPAFKNWIKKGVSEDEIKTDLLACGFPNIAGFAGTKASTEETTRAEECMFKKGFQYRDGWKGLCAEDKRFPLAACGEQVPSKN